MVKDRYGNEVSSVDSITVLDTSLDYDSEVLEDTNGFKLETFDRDRFRLAYEVDFGAGADWPAVAYEVLDKFIPFSAVAAALFYGEKIEKSILAWKRMALSLLSLIPDGGFTDANGAALLALEAIFESSDASTVKLMAYTWIDEEIELFDEADKISAAFNIIMQLDEIQSRDLQFGDGLHSHPTFLFKFKADEKTILAKVRCKEVSLSNALDM